MKSVTNRFFLIPSIMTLMLIFFGYDKANAQWSIAGTTNEGVITPTTISQTTAGFNPNGLVPYWSFTGTAGVCYYFALCNAVTNNEDAVLNVYSGASPGGSLVAANDEGACPSKSSLTFVCPVTATYYISANVYPANKFGTNKTLNLNYYICGAVTPVATPVTEDWSVSNVTTACTNWMAHGAGSEGDWAINNAALGFAYGLNLAGGTGNELIFAGDQYEVYGIGVTKLATVTSYPINTNGTNTMQFSWQQSLQINGDNAISGSNTVILKLQSSSDLINWNDEWVGTYSVTLSSTNPFTHAIQSVTINTNTNVTTWLRFYLSAVPGKLAYWAIDNGSTGIIILPVELTSFTAKQLNTKTKLEWATASESNNNYFTIEKSLDGTSFTSINEIKGAGNSTTNLNYSAFDEEPAVGINYYRLKQTDYNGKFKYSKVISVNYLSKGASFSNLHPNPANENINFDLYSPVNTKGNLQVMDITGRVISEESQNISAGNQTIGTTLNALSNGIYYLKISIDEIGYSHISKIIKN